MVLRWSEAQPAEARLPLGTQPRRLKHRPCFIGTGAVLSCLEEESNIYTVFVLVTNALAILSEDRFLARIGWSSSAPAEPAFGTGVAGEASVKSKIIDLIASVRTLMRSE